MTTDIQITRKKDEPGATTLAVEAPVERVRAAERKVAAQYAKRARLPGFRRGRVPPDVIRRRFGAAIREAVLQELVTDSWKLALDREKIEPIGEPRVHELKFEENEPVTFEFLVEVKPDVTLERITGFTIERRQPPVTEQMVTEQLEEIRRQHAPLVPVTSEKPKPGDHVRVTLATITDGEADEGKSYDLEIGSGQAIPGIEERITTMETDETVEGPITFPEDFADESKRGQTVTVRITLHEIKRRELPDPTDDFAREVGDFETMDALKSAIRTDLESAAKREADAQVRRQLIEQITAANSVPAPRPMVERLLRAYARAYEVPQDQLEKFAAEFGPIVEGQVRRDLIIDHVASAEKLAATEDEVDERIDEIAKRQNVSPGQVYTSLQKDNRLKELERSITEQKVFDHLLSSSTVTDAK